MFVSTSVRNGSSILIADSYMSGKDGFFEPGQSVTIPMTIEPGSRITMEALGNIIEHDRSKHASI